MCNNLGLFDWNVPVLNSMIYNNSVFVKFKFNGLCFTHLFLPFELRPHSQWIVASQHGRWHSRNIFWPGKGTESQCQSVVEQTTQPRNPCSSQLHCLRSNYLFRNFRSTLGCTRFECRDIHDKNSQPYPAAREYQLSLTSTSTFCFVVC